MCRIVTQSAASFDRRPNGVIYARSVRALGAYPAKITERLEHWAVHSGARTFLAQRCEDGSWETITYAQALHRVRSIAQGLLDRDLSADRPIAILSGNSIDHALLALAAMYTGMPYAPLRYLPQSLRPSLILASGAGNNHALQNIDTGDADVIESCAALATSDSTTAVDDAHESVGPDTVAKILFTSGSTGQPKGVINTQRMLCSNQEMIRSVLGFLADEPPVLCDWLPWNHTYGGNHNFGIVLYNGGTLYIDDGKPTASSFPTTLANLSEVATTAYFNVPRGYEMLVPALRTDPGLRETFFSGLRIFFSAGAEMKQQVWDDLRQISSETCGEEIPIVTGFGATESAPAALLTGGIGASASGIGLPVPGMELKLVPVDEKLELRFRGPNVTPGFWRNDELTRSSFDEEGYYRTGDAVTFADPNDPQKGFRFECRIAENFKLSTGTWVSAAFLRARFLVHFGAAVRDVIIAGSGRDYVAALVFLHQTISRLELQRLLDEFASQSTGSSTRVTRILIVEEAPNVNAREITDKGTIDMKVVLASRAALVEELYAPACSDRVIEISAEP